MSVLYYLDVVSKIGYWIKTETVAAPVTAIVCVVNSNNQLKDLPDELSSLHLLREIAISYNR